MSMPDDNAYEQPIHRPHPLKVWSGADVPKPETAQGEMGGKLYQLDHWTPETWLATPIEDRPEEVIEFASGHRFLVRTMFGPAK